VGARFITFEGGEGSGKSTQIIRLAGRLEALGERVLVTREPGGSPKAERLRSALLSGTARRHGPFAEALLFAAARLDHLRATIRPALAEGKIVLSDRFSDSTRVYQGVLGAVPEATLAAFDRLVVEDTRPDLTFILDVPAETGLARAAERRRRRGEAADRFEAEALADHERLRQAFRALAAAEPGRCVLVDAAEPAEAVEEAIWTVAKVRVLDGGDGNRKVARG
jgi:dTMP kinase